MKEDDAWNAPTREGWARAQELTPSSFLQL
jgi:hypothetical protein